MTACKTATGRRSVVYRFTTGGEKITAIELIADAAPLRELALVIPLDAP